MDWKTAWSYLPVNHNTCIGTVENITQRSVFKNNLSGTKVKIKFSNLFSKDALVIDHVTIGTKDLENNNDIKKMQAVTYQGKETIRIESGEEFYSDEIDYALSNGEDIVVSIYIKERTEICSVCSTWEARSWYTQYGLAGNFVAEQEFTETDAYEVFPVLKYDINRANHIFGITEIKVYTEQEVKTVALFGDSITHMSYYSDALIEKLYDSYPGKITVVNRGLGGNRLLRDYSRIEEIPSGGTIFGEAGVERFYHDIYSSDQPDHIIVLIGINDLTHPYALKHLDEAITIDEYQEGIIKLIDIAHEKGSKILLGTLTPFIFGAEEWYTPVETLRQLVNQWIRSQKYSDGIVDFDLATRQSKTPERMLEDCHLGDGLHPNSEGGRKMAEAIDVDWLI